jgi:hypothetical protein
MTPLNNKRNVIRFKHISPKNFKMVNAKGKMFKRIENRVGAKRPNGYQSTKL